MSITRTDPLAEMIRRPSTGDLSQATAIEQARAIAEVAAAVKVAQDFPRNLDRAEGELRDACGRMALAQKAFYRVPNRGNGPSVHLAREVARIWGNVQYGVWETRRDDEAGISEIQAWAWDVQTNTRSSRSFVVPHQRMVKDDKGRQTRKPLVDLGDVYLNNQNIGARAVRECIWTVIPTWFVELGEDICRQTLRDGDGKPLKVRIDEMVAAFRDHYGVTTAQLEKRLGRKRGQWDPGDVAQMVVTYQSLSRGEMRVEDEFDVATARPSTGDFTATPKNDGGAAADPDSTSPEPGADPSPAPPSITKAQSTKLHAAFNDLGITDREQRLAYCTNLLGREIATSNDLTKDEASRVINALEADLVADESGEAGWPVDEDATDQAES